MPEFQPVPSDATRAAFLLAADTMNRFALLAHADPGVDPELAARINDWQQALSGCDWPILGYDTSDPPTSATRKHCRRTWSDAPDTQGQWWIAVGTTARPGWDLYEQVPVNTSLRDWLIERRDGTKRSDDHYSIGALLGPDNDIVDVIDEDDDD